MNEFTRKAMELADGYAENKSSLDLAMTEVWRSELYLSRRRQQSDAARSALLAHLEGAEQKWLPIETAPKVVGRIIGAVEGRARFICWGKASHVPMYGWVLTDQGPEECDLCQPTHWMALPDAAALGEQHDR